MEKSLRQIADGFPVDEQKLKTYSPLSFAYIGDSVFDLIIRTMITAEGNSRPNRYHGIAIKYVNAKAQATMMKHIEPHLTEQEMSIFRRGKNAKPATCAKNQSHHDYRIATGFEALIGYLYLAGRMERIMELAALGLEAYEKEQRSI